MTGRDARSAKGGYSVLLVDSDPGFLNTNCQLIAEDGHRAWGAEDLLAAANFLADQLPDLMLVEVALLDMDGADPLGDLRDRAPSAPVVLMASGPPDECFRNFCRKHSIYGYHDKEHGSDSLRLWVNAAFGAARQADALRRTREGLRQVLEAVPELHRIQSLDTVLQVILGQVDGLIGGKNAFVAARMSDPVGKPPLEGLDEVAQTTDDYVVCAASSDGFPPGTTIDQLKSVPAGAVRRAVQNGEQVLGERHAILPLTLAEHVLGLAYLDHPVVGDRDPDLLSIYASQAAAAIRNAALYELATIDSTTRVFRKDFTLERLSETLKLAWRKGFPVSLVMIDIDNFKELNDQYGHIAGDRALRHLGALLKRNVRDSDIVGRFGGDEFLVVLLDANAEGAQTAVRRLYGELGRQSGRPWPDSLPPIRVNMGIVTIDAEEEADFQLGFPNFDRAAEQLVSGADAAMIRSRTDPEFGYTSPVFTWEDFIRVKA
jgi:diguanylate cyclase (GGDEF)-like protein